MPPAAGHRSVLLRLPHPSAAPGHDLPAEGAPQPRPADARCQPVGGVL